MTKKLLMWSALLMTGFAFYSCDEAIDNPVGDQSSEWTYEVSVKFADFKFLNDPAAPNTVIVDGESNPYTYQAPQKIYVFNTAGQELGSLTTADEITDLTKSYKFAGRLQGAIGEELIISTLSGADYSKQDGTLKSIVDNSIILEMDTVPVNHYSAVAGVVSTPNAELNCNVGIGHFRTWNLDKGDVVTISSEAFTAPISFKLSEADTFDPNNGAPDKGIYVAIPADADPADYTITAARLDGFTVSCDLEGINIKNGQILNADTWGNAFGIGFTSLGVDLTVWDAYQREVNNATGTLWFGQYIGADATFTITQSGTEPVDARINFNGNLDDDVKLIVNNVKLADDCYFGIDNGAKFDITFIGENKLNQLNMNSPFTWKGLETCQFDELNIGGSAYVSGSSLVVDYAAEYTINEDMTLKHLSVYNGGKLTIAEGKKVTVINDEQRAVSVYQATFNLGKGATLQAECKAKDESVINIENATFNVGENAIVTAQGGKEGTGLGINNYSYSSSYNATSNINIGKNATVTLIGGPEGILGYGINIYNNNNSTTNITLDEGAKLNATGIDRFGINCQATDWNDLTNKVTINIAKNAKITAEDVESGVGFNAYTYHATLTIDGEGTFEAKSKDGIGMQLENGYQAVINFKGGNISAISGGNNPAITCNSNPFTIAPEIKSFKAQKGATATTYISQYGNEMELDDLVADKTKFNDATADGVRTITPKPAAE